ncbi:putative sigma-54 modulation protein [Acetoanaerobium pronyense]|uniref:Ribosome hibernation promoting factor n=1 Tax=Acetoanaerobium pronyense TaxID=1482736 RepID=A0ABS4KIY1_9FIRM|nr:ribosome-associated translation inhibitor RaiA [Acetoanaerobium pronyense]MBP2027753.1 putative sigma-54 modulation protein [Acetoanaerobium pronyense]
MRVILSGKQIDVTDAMRTSVDTKLSRLDKYFSDEAIARVTASVVRNLHKIEVTIPVGNTVMRAEATDTDLYNATDMVVDKIGRQIRKHKTKLMDKGHETIRFENVESYIRLSEEENENGKIVKRKKFGFKPMSEEEAILQMEMLGHNFFVFTHSETEDVAVLYKRKDGNYGILEADEF